MKVTLQCQINEVNGTIIENKLIETHYDDPIFLNMQFCMERHQFEEYKKLCKEWKHSGIHEVLKEMLDEVEPERIFCFLEQQFSQG